MTVKVTLLHCHTTFEPIKKNPAFNTYQKKCNLVISRFMTLPRDPQIYKQRFKAIKLRRCVKFVTMQHVQLLKKKIRASAQL
jgi:hypothetical protein